MRQSKKLTAGLGIVTAGLLSTGIAFAAWTSNGSGAGTAQSTTSEDSSITAGVSAADLYPGAVKSVTVTITNPNDYPVVVTSISGSSSTAIVDEEEDELCAAGAVTRAARTVDATGLLQSDGTTKTIAANGNAQYTLATSLVADPSDGCKSQSFNLPLTATLRSNAS